MQSMTDSPVFVVADFEFRSIGGIEGNPLEVICAVFKNTQTGAIEKLWRDELLSLKGPPFFQYGSEVLVAFFATAELVSFKALGWNTDIPVLDLYSEYRVFTNGIEPTPGRSLLSAMTFFGLEAMEPEQKESMRQLALRGGPYSESEKYALLDYCCTDVKMTEQLFQAMATHIDYPRALLRGAFSTAVADMESHGSPVDLATLQGLLRYWPAIKDELIREVDQDFGVYENGVFREYLFERFLHRQGISWPRLESGRLKLDEETFKKMSQVHPQLKPLRTLRDSLSKLRLSSLQIGEDGRNRCLLSPFGASTGRNTPSSNKFIFGLPKWARGLLQPKLGISIAYLDFGQEEFAIAGVLSGDTKMLEAYQSGDPYLTFAIQAGALPKGATKDEYPEKREQFKRCILATQYGMGAESLAQWINQPVIQARQLLAMHRRVYSQFWKWSDEMFDRAVATNQMQTVYGWKLQLKADLNPRSVRNFPMQATGAEILRIACILVREAGVQLCAPVHDALLIEAPDTLIWEHVDKTRACMNQASQTVLSGFTLKNDVQVLSYPDRFLDKDHQPFWNQVMELLARAREKSYECSNTNVSEHLTPVHSYLSY